MIGGAIAFLAGLGLITIPGVGPFLAAGPLLAAFSGILAGAGFGGVAGGLIGLGITESEARRLESELRDGKPLVSVHVKNADERFRAEGIFADFSPADEITLRDSTILM